MSHFHYHNVMSASRQLRCVRGVCVRSFVIEYICKYTRLTGVSALPNSSSQPPLDFIRNVNVVSDHTCAFHRRNVSGGCFPDTGIFVDLLHSDDSSW